MIPKTENPWDVESIYTLQYYVCPSCTYKHMSKQNFICHAFDAHLEESVDYLKNIKDGSLSDILCPWDSNDDYKNDNDNIVVDNIKSEFDINEDYLDEFEDEIIHDETFRSASIEIPAMEEEAEYESMDPLKLSKEDILKKSPTVIVKRTNKFPKCDLCGKYFSEETKLMDHVCSNAEPLESQDYEFIKKSFKCDSCEKIFSRPHDLKVHTYAIHEGHKDHTCDSCGKFFLEDRALQKHINAVHKNKKDYKCDICGKSFPYLASIGRHKKSVHEDQKDFKCESCGKEFSLKQRLTEHIDLMHTTKEEYKCKLCDEAIATRYEFKQHKKSCGILNDDNQNKLKCKYCNKEYSLTCKRTLIKHIELKHIIKDHKCEPCGKYFSKADLKEHINEFHVSNEGIQCDKCGVSFSKTEYLTKHNKIVHEGFKKYKCEDCGELFGYSTSLKHHMAYKHGFKDLLKKRVCDHCGKFFLTTKLKAHIINVHEGHKEYKCDICGKPFTHKQGLKKHIHTIHEGQKDYKCEHCGKLFTRALGLKEHIHVIHEGRKDYKCESCGKSFGTKNILDRHVETVHKGIKRFKCLFCNTAYGQSGDLNRHIKRCHPQGVQN